MAPANKLASASADSPPCIEFLDALRFSEWRPVRRRRTRTALVGGGKVLSLAPSSKLHAPVSFKFGSMPPAPCSMPTRPLAGAAGHRGPSRRSRDKGRLLLRYYQLTPKLVAEATCLRPPRRTPARPAHVALRVPQARDLPRAPLRSGVRVLWCGSWLDRITSVAVFQGYSLHR